MKKNIFRSAFMLASLISVSSFAEVASMSEYSRTIITVPKGNTLAEMPAIPQSSLNNWAKDVMAIVSSSPTQDQLIARYTQRYNQVMNVILVKYETSEFSLKNEIINAARLYNVDPTHIVAAIVGEHVFNVGLTDSVQQMTLNLGKWMNILPDVNEFAEVLQCKQMRVCEASSNDYDKWDCYDGVWMKSFAGRSACGERRKNTNFIGNFFNPSLLGVNMGVTYGLGQVGPFKVLSLNDMVVRTSGLPVVSIYDQKKIYEAVLDPKTTVHYIAALMRKNIDLYRDYAHFDISKNIGISTTLYNLGYEKRRAQSLYKENLNNLGQGQALRYPQVNYYGWFMNHFEDRLRKAFGFVKNDQ